MTPKLILLTLITLGFGTTSYANADPGADPKNGIKKELLGMVQHSETKKPLQKVNITAYNGNQKQLAIVSDDNGNYSFNELKPGTYRFIFEKNGFKSVTKDNIVVKTDEGMMINILMEETRAFNVGPNVLHFSDF